MLYLRINVCFIKSFKANVLEAFFFDDNFFGTLDNLSQRFVNFEAVVREINGWLKQPFPW